MSRPEGKTKTILHFSCDPTGLMLRAEFLSGSGYRVLNSSNGFEAMELCAWEAVDAVVLDLDHSRVESALIAREIKRCQPGIPVVMLTEAPVDGVREFADAVLPMDDDLALGESLKKLLSQTGYGGRLRA